MAFPSVMLTAAVPAQAEWNGNDIMFIQERRSQTQISVSKMLGCSRRENTLETRRWISSPRIHTAPPTTPPTYSHAQRKSCFAHPQLSHTSHTQVSTYATPCHMHARTDTNAHATHTTIFLPNISHRRISTHATMTAHTYTTGSELHKYPETYTDVYNHFLSPYRWPHSTRTLR